eukprot:4744120-Amphidinium_carterae.1
MVTSGCGTAGHHVAVVAAKDASQDDQAPLESRSGIAQSTTEKCNAKHALSMSSVQAKATLQRCVLTADPTPKRNCSCSVHTQVRCWGKLCNKDWGATERWQAVSITAKMHSCWLCFSTVSTVHSPAQEDKGVGARLVT